MSAIFETEMRDLDYIKDGEPRKAKASTAKLVLLALADHANDYGESSYPGYDHLEIKTALSRQGLADTLEALRYNGLLTIEVRGSRLGTNSYTINIRSFPPMYKEVEALPEVVKPLDSSKSSQLTSKSQATRRESSVNHPLTTIEEEGNSDLAAISKAYESEIGMITSFIADDLQDASTTYPLKWVLDAIHEAAVQNKRGWKYCLAILKRWKAQGNQNPVEKQKAQGKPAARPATNFDANMEITRRWLEQQREAGNV